MNCEQTLIHIDNFFAETLSDEEKALTLNHLANCSSCAHEFRQEEELLKACRNLPVPPPSEDFVKRTLAKARIRHHKQQTRQLTPLAGLAIAACLALLLMVTAPFDKQSSPIAPQQQAINIKINEHRTIQVVVNVPRDIMQADVFIELPPQVELAGFPGHREIRWSTDLHKGRNLLNLPLVAKSTGNAKLVTHINHENKSKILSLVMNVSNDELTRRGHYAPTNV